MTTVGIIANPASGKDIRRLIAQGSVFDNQEKVNIVRRVMVGLESAGVDEVVFMPDYFGIGRRALDGLHVNLKASDLEMVIEANQDDSTRAAGMMRDMKVGAILTLGGDGTNRAVAKEIGDIPILPISTGTNNVFPQMVEGTLAGLAAGLVARQILPLQETTQRQHRLDILKDGALLDLALVDVVAYQDSFIGSRAVWDMTKVREIILTRASPSSIGLSSIGGSLYCARLNSRHGVYIVLSEGKAGVEVSAPIAPGLVEKIHVTEYRLLTIGTEVPLQTTPSILALDGEREVIVRDGDQISIHFTDQGPIVIDLHKTLQVAAERGLQVEVDLPDGLMSGCLLRSAGLCVNPLEECLS